MNLLENKKVRFDYEIIESFEAGMSLQGWEVKSLRSKNAQIKSAWIKIRDGEAWVMNMRILRWKFSQNEMEENRERKLLLHKSQIQKIERKIHEKKYTLIPIRVYLSRGKIKMEIILGKGRQKHEKRQVLRDRATKKEANSLIRKF